ncbi:MAG: hypothetical protein R2882_03470 [Gemmatimonadales bacterium]
MTVTAPAPTAASFTSSGFFLAAMMPLSEGSRGVLTPLSVVTTVTA